MKGGSLTVVLDASALLAVLSEEEGAEVVEGVLAGAVINTVNLAEVAAKLVDRKVPADQARHLLDGLGLDIQPFTREDAYETSNLKARLPTSLSLGDRACFATALRLGAVVYTADRAWKVVRPGIEVRLIR